MSYNVQSRVFNAYALASLYLRTAGLPDTARNRRILAAWFMSESSTRGLPKGYVNVSNNNPLNYTCSACSNYHQYDGNSLKFQNYSGTTAGAQAWAIALNKSYYLPIRAAFQAQDWAAFEVALRHAPWGTSANTWANVYRNLTDSGTGQALQDYADGSVYSTDYQTHPNPPSLGAFWVNGKPIFSKPQGETFTDADVAKLMKALEDAGFFSGHFPVADLIARGQFEDILKKHIGEAWTPQLLAKIAEETGLEAAFVGGLVPNAINNLPVVGPTVQLANRLNELLAPDKFGSSAFHLFGILLGTGLVIYGIRVIFRSANVEGISAGGGNNTTEVIETRYPMIIEDDLTPNPDVTQGPAMITTTGAQSAAVRARHRTRKDPNWEPTPIPDYIKSNGIQSREIAPLKQVPE